MLCADVGLLLRDFERSMLADNLNVRPLVVPVPLFVFVAKVL